MGRPAGAKYARKNVKAIPHNSKCRYGKRGAADAVPQLPEGCLSRKAGIVRCRLKNIVCTAAIKAALKCDNKEQNAE